MRIPPNISNVYIVLARLSVTKGTATATSISLSWTSAGSVVNSYEVKWKYDGECSGVRGGRASVGGAMNSYSLTGLEAYIIYSITVTVTNDVGIAVSGPSRHHLQ